MKSNKLLWVVFVPVLCITVTGYQVQAQEPGSGSTNGNKPRDRAATIDLTIVADKIKGNRFAIKTNAPNVEVSWQVTGVRSDPTARKYRFEIEEAKADRDRGYYLNPDAYDQPEEKGIQWARDSEGMKQLRERRIEAERTRERKRNDR